MKEKFTKAFDKFAENDYEVPRKKVAAATEFIFSKIESFRSRKSKGKKSVASSSTTDTAASSSASSEEEIDKIPLSPNPIDLDQAKSLDQGGDGITYYDTENSELARGAPKATPKGIDSFGERDTYNFDEADDFQTNRDRNQNSDLAQRFQTGGLSAEDLSKRH